MFEEHKKDIKEISERLNTLIQQEEEILKTLQDNRFLMKEALFKLERITGERLAIFGPAVTLTMTEAEQRLKDAIIANDRYSKGVRNFVLTQFRTDLIEFAEKENYTGRIPAQSSLSEYISPTNRKRHDPQLIRLAIKMVEGIDIAISDPDRAIVEGTGDNRPTMKGERGHYLRP